MNRVCSRSGRIYSSGQRCNCPACIAHRRADNKRRANNEATAGRLSPHWQKLRLRAIARDRHCQRCGTTNDLTVHLDPAKRGQHRNARLEDCTTLCRSCHGSIDAPRAAASAKANRLSVRRPRLD
jgi:5-methylcytosine-specific restriction endonuclease McrA